MHSENLIIVRNLHSSNAKRVDDEVLRSLKNAGISFDTYETVPDAKKNIENMAQFPEDAKVVTAAGDGTASQLVSARLQGQNEFTIGFLPYGNFNDLAKTHLSSSQSVLDLIQAQAIERSALSIEVNGDHWRHAPAYATFGLTARIAAGYDAKESRAVMRESSQGGQLARRLGQAFSDYLRYKEEKIEPYRVNGGVLINDSTDIAVANNPIAAGMIRQREYFYDQQYFGVEEGVNLHNLLEAAHFGVLSMTGFSPLKRLETMHVAFEKAATLHAQTEGEYERLEDVREVFIYKDPQNVYKVLHAKKRQ